MFELFWYGIIHFIKEWVLLPFNLILGIGSYAVLFGLGMLLLHLSKYMENLVIVRIQKIFAFILFSVPISFPIIYSIAFSMNATKNQANIDNDIKNIGEHYYEVENKDTFILNDITYIRFEDIGSIEIHDTDNCKAILKYDDSEEAPINHYMYIYETTNNSRFDIIAVKYISNKSKDVSSTWYYVEQPYNYHKQTFNNPIEKYTDTIIFPTKEDITTYPESYTFDDINLVKCYISDEIISYTDDGSSVLERNTKIIRNSDEFALDWFDTISFNFDPTFKVQNIDENNQIYHLDIILSDYNAHGIYMTSDIYWIGPSKQKGSYYIDNTYFENNDVLKYTLSDLDHYWEYGLTYEGTTYRNVKWITTYENEELVTKLLRIDTNELYKWPYNGSISPSINPKFTLHLDEGDINVYPSSDTQESNCPYEILWIKSLSKESYDEVNGNINRYFIDEAFFTKSNYIGIYEQSDSSEE